jgi:hypothetical protein
MTKTTASPFRTASERLEDRVAATPGGRSKCTGRRQEQHGQVARV